MVKHLSILLGSVALCACFAGLSITSLDPEKLNQPFSLLSSFSWLYWLGVVLFFLSVIKALKEDKFSHLFMIVVGSLILWAVPVFTFSSAYGRDAYFHWHFVRQLSDSGHLELGSSNDYINQYPMAYIFGTMINRVLGLTDETVFLRFLVYFRIMPVVLFPIFFYLFTSLIIDDPQVSFLAALSGILGNVFMFPMHYSPFTISASTLPILMFFSFKYSARSAENPVGKIGRKGVMLLLIMFSTMVLTHLPTTMVYLTALVLLVLLLSRYRKFPYLLFIVVFLAYTLTVATYGLTILTHFLRNASMVVMGTSTPMLTSTFGTYVYPWVSWIRWTVVLIFAVPACCIILWHIYKRKLGALEVMFLGTFSLVLLLSSTRYGEFATRALFLIIPFSAIMVFNYMKGSLHRFKKPRILFCAVFLIAILFLSTLTVSYIDAGARAISASELEGLRFLGNRLVVEGETIVAASSELLVFANTNYSSGLTIIGNYSQMMQGSIIVFQRSIYWYASARESQQLFLDYIDIATNKSDKIFDSGGLVVFQNANEAH